MCISYLDKYSKGKLLKIFEIKIMLYSPTIARASI